MIKIVFEKKQKHITKNRFMRGCIITIFIATIIFTAGVFVSTHFTGADHSTLVQWWFTAMIVEAGGLLLKKYFDDKKKKDTEETEEE